MDSKMKIYQIILISLFSLHSYAIELVGIELEDNIYSQSNLTKENVIELSDTGFCDFHRASGHQILMKVNQVISDELGKKINLAEELMQSKDFKKTEKDIMAGSIVCKFHNVALLQQLATSDWERSQYSKYDSSIATNFFNSISSNDVNIVWLTFDYNSGVLFELTLSRSLPDYDYEDFKNMIDAYENKWKPRKVATNVSPITFYFENPTECDFSHHHSQGVSSRCITNKNKHEVAMDAINMREWYEKSLNYGREVLISKDKARKERKSKMTL